MQVLRVYSGVLEPPRDGGKRADNKAEIFDQSSHNPRVSRYRAFWDHYLHFKGCRSSLTLFCAASQPSSSRRVIPNFSMRFRNVARVIPSSFAA